MFITWGLFGIWHGAGWNFMFLGLLQAIAIYYEFVTKKWRSRVFSRFPTLIRIWLGRLATYFFYCVSLTFFFAADLRSGFAYFPALFNDNKMLFERVKLEYVPLFFVFLFIIFEIIEKDFSQLYHSFISIWNADNKISIYMRWLLYFCAIALIIVSKNKIEEFIYIQF